MEYLKTMLIGGIIGIANIIPGVSGGTMMVVLDVFDKLVHSISNLRKEFKNSVRFLSAIVIGAGIALVLLSGGINWMLDYHYMITNFFFIGVIFGSFPMVWGKATLRRFCPVNLIPCAVTFGIMLLMTSAAPQSAEMVVTALSLPVFFKLFVCSAVAAVCMIIPGISGSFVMVLLGTYQTVITAISNLNILILIPVGLGVLMGILLGSKLLSKLLEKFPQGSYFAILGFMAGSVPAIFEKIRLADAFVGGWSLVLGIVVFLLGGALAFAMSNEKLKERLIAGRQKKNAE